MKPRYLPEKAFPSYVFIPGENPHPKKAGGHMEGQEDPKASPVNEAKPFESEFLRYSLDLLNHGYFWESHVYFEALWNAHERRGAVADFLKAMIKLGAAGIKMKTGHKTSAEGHLTRARELFQTVLEQKGEVFLGFHLKELMLLTIEARDESGLKVYPDWE